MTREEYLKGLEQALGFLNEPVRRSAVEFYAEMLDDRLEAASAQPGDGSAEAAAVAGMEPIQTIADRLRAEMTESSQHPDAKDAKDPDEYEKRTLTVPAGELTAVRLCAHNRAIRISSTQDDQATLTYATCERDEYRAYTQDGALVLERVASKPGHRGWKWFGLQVLFGFNPPPVELTLPENALVSLHAETSNAAITVGGLKTLCQTELITSNGAVTAENIACLQLDATTSNAHVTIRDVAVKRTLIVKTSNAPIRCQDTHSGGALTLRTSNGGVHAADVRAGAAMTLITSNGGLDVEKLDAPALSLRTSNGRIRGTLHGPQSAWQIESGASNGSNSLPRNQPGEKPLSVHTSNGPIKLQFEE